MSKIRSQIMSFARRSTHEMKKIKLYGLQSFNETSKIGPASQIFPEISRNVSETFSLEMFGANLHSQVGVAGVAERVAEIEVVEC